MWRKRSVHWWTTELTVFHKKCVIAQRLYQWTGPVEHEAERTMFCLARKALRLTARKTSASWSRLCEQVDSNPWGLPYRIVVKGLGRANPNVAAHNRSLPVSPVDKIKTPTLSSRYSQHSSLHRGRVIDGGALPLLREVSQSNGRPEPDASGALC